MKKKSGGINKEVRNVPKMKQNESETFWSKLKRGYNPMEEGVRWTEKYSDDLERMWKKMPVFLQKVCFVTVIALLGSSLKGKSSGLSVVSEIVRGFIHELSSLDDLNKKKSDF